MFSFCWRCFKDVGSTEWSWAGCAVMLSDYSAIILLRCLLYLVYPQDNVVLTRYEVTYVHKFEL